MLSVAGDDAITSLSTNSKRISDKSTALQAFLDGDVTTDDYFRTGKNSQSRNRSTQSAIDVS